MKRYISLVLVALMVLGLVPGGAWGDSIEDRIKFLQDQVNYMNENNIHSTPYTSTLYIDLSGISNSGSVSTYVYSGEDPSPLISSFTTTPRNFDYAIDKLTRYILGNIANTYRQEPLNTEITMVTWEKISIPTYVYGDYKEQAISEILQGLPTCFDISYNTSSGRSIPIKPISTPIADQLLHAIFSIDNKSFQLNDKVIIMDTAPEIKDNRTYLPIRYLANSLGVTDENIKWDNVSYTATITKNDVTVQVTIDKNVMLVNKESKQSSVTMDTSPYLKNGRVMLPARWIAEPLGAKVEWDESKKQTIIQVQQVEQSQ